MKQKTHEEKIQELDTKINQIEARKERMKNRLKEKERKERTRRLIQVGAIFENHFEIEGKEQAELIASGLAEYVKQNKNVLFQIGVKKSKERKKNMYEIQEDQLIIPYRKTKYKVENRKY